MARRFLTSIDLTKNELQNPRIHQLAAPPASPVTGQLYYDTAANRLYYWNGSGWIATDGSSVTYATPNFTLGTAAAAGVASSVVRSDATIPIFDATAPSTQAIGDAAAVGAAAFAARRDHKHGLPSFGNVVAQTTFGAGSGNGSAATPARSDHTHGTPAHDNAAHSAINRSALAAPTADVGWGGFKITNLGTPTADTDAATKAYADAVATGLDLKQSVRAATTANITLSGTQTIDGVAVVGGDRVLVKNQSTASQNGVYVVAAGAWARATDADSNTEVNSGMFVFVEEGTLYADTGWVLATNNPITVGTTALSFAQFSGAGSYTAGAGLTQSGTTFNVGQGAGIVVGADDVAIDTAVVVRKYATSVGNGSATSFVVTHNLGTQDVVVAVRDNTTPFAFMEADIEATSTNTVTVRFTVAPTSNQYRVIVHA